ncbi:MAG: hypothetical protein ACRDH7_09255 [Actinomycetota bacterium]
MLLLLFRSEIATGTVVTLIGSVPVPVQLLQVTAVRPDRHLTTAGPSRFGIVQTCPMPRQHLVLSANDDDMVMRALAAMQRGVG